MQTTLHFVESNSFLSIDFAGELTLYSIGKLEKQMLKIDLIDVKTIELNLHSVTFIDTAIAIFLVKTEENFRKKGVNCSLICNNKTVLSTLELVKVQRSLTNLETKSQLKKQSFIKKKLKDINTNFYGFVSFIAFFGKLFVAKTSYLKSFKNIRFKEIAYEINESAIKALGIVALTSFLIGLVVAYQSAFQLKTYGANIFIVDMLGISILRELAPLITAIVIAGRSGSAFTAQIGAMKITQELDAMKTMGFDPFAFLVLPRIIALMIAMPILIFVADIMGIIGGMIVSNADLGISSNLFLDRFREVIEAKQFFIGIIKGPFFAFLIASIGVYRGLSVKDDTQSIGFNTTKSVVESIFAVIVCDALFSIALTNLGI